MGFVQQKCGNTGGASFRTLGFELRGDWSVHLRQGARVKTYFSTSDAFREEDRGLWTGGLSFQSRKVWNVPGD